MQTDDRINLLAKVARTPHSPRGDGQPTSDRSILTLAAASYGSRPTDESTVPTGFDPFAAALFESIVEGAYLVATSDGVFDDEERRTFERIVTAACGGTVPQSHVADLVSDLADQLGEDGIERRIQRLAEGIQREEQAIEVLRIAALIAQVSDDVSDVERTVLGKIALACQLGDGAVDRALDDVKASLATPS
ncbi:MAG: tellurite resistance TerB family protein [Labilithrix sp.]|nr:tellurite resistance TerB family protein [Labilithrix sp.]MBX3220080.1 tellurite resistance TerB family protein [Labilithrix sp.]